MITVTPLKRLTLVMVVGLLLVACANPMMKSTPSLYERLGGKPAITTVVDDFVAKVAADNRINGQFAHANIPHLKKELVDQICAGTGGPCIYTGLDMKTAHAGRHITSMQFDALVEDLVKTLDKFKVPAREKNELLGILGPMKSDIVNE